VKWGAGDGKPETLGANQHSVDFRPAEPMLAILSLVFFAWSSFQTVVLYIACF